MFTIRRIFTNSRKAATFYQLVSLDGSNKVYPLGDFPDLLSACAALRYINGVPMDDVERAQVTSVLDALAERQERDARNKY